MRRSANRPWSGVWGCSVIAVLLATGLGHGTPSDQDGWRYSGEFGLYVELIEDGLEVRWLTSEPTEGVVRALVDDVVVDAVDTETADAHVARLEIDAPLVTLEYGDAAGEDLTRTRIRIEPPEPVAPSRAVTDSIFLFGDVHGEFDRVVSLLRGSGLIDEDLRWTGGRRTVALLGDLFDRGDDVTRLLWFLYGLEDEARAVGGDVLVVLGNHEVMVMSGDLRYVSGKEASLGFRHRLSYKEMFDPRTSILGRWLASKPGLVRLDDLLLAHGGVSPGYLELSLEAFRDTLERWVAEPLFVHWDDRDSLVATAIEMELDSAAVARRWDFFFSPESVLWYRDLVRSDTLASHLERVLDRHDATLHVVAHTPVQSIQERYEGRLIAVDLVDAASEMLLLVREADGWGRFKIPLDGEPERLEALP
ncbi:MAG: metallophosphoesterase [Gemmatimonadetes bacterium]|nr:metallophosphoesterase [Gemmatimonadota bacterium]